MTAKWIDATCLDAARSGLVNATRYNVEVRSTHTFRTGWIVWLAMDRQCCDTQAGWPAGRIPQAWDPTGVGVIEIASHVQCGGCGTLIYPPYSRLIKDDDDVSEIADEIYAEAFSATEAERAKILARVQRELDDALAVITAGGEVGDAVTGSEVTPGVYVERGRLVSWDFDPADRDGSETITVTAELEGGIA